MFDHTFYSKGSWKIKIRDRLKHMRRPSKRQIGENENSLPSKHQRRLIRLDETTVELEQEDV